MEESSSESTATSSKPLPVSALVHRFASSRKRKKSAADDLDQSDGGDEIESRIEALQRIVPGGERLAVDELFEETAEYIVALQSKVKAMRALEHLFRTALHKQHHAKLGG